MMRRLPRRRPEPRLPAAPAGRQPLWRRPLALIFRARREAAPRPSATYRSADGVRVTLAPRLQVALHFWTRLATARHDHRAARVDASRNHWSPLTQLYRTRHFHFHAGRDVAWIGRSSNEGPPPPQGEVSRRRERVEELHLMRQQAWAAEAFARPARLREASSEPAPLRLRRGAATALQPAEPAAAELRSTPSSPPWTTVDAPIRRFHRTPAAQMSGTAPMRLHRPALAVSRTAGQQPPAPERLRQLVPTACLPRLVPTAPLDLAARPDRRRNGPTEASTIVPQRRYISAAPLEFRRSAPPASSHEIAPPSHAAPQPAVPAIDVDALSRDVISRIEKRLRIERERHGRI